MPDCSAAGTRLRKIGQLKKLGLSLDEIGDVIDLYFADPSGVRAKQSGTPTPIAELLHKIVREGTR